MPSLVFSKDAQLLPLYAVPEPACLLSNSELLWLNAVYACPASSNTVNPTRKSSFAASNEMTVFPCIYAVTSRIENPNEVAVEEKSSAVIAFLYSSTAVAAVLPEQAVNANSATKAKLDKIIFLINDTPHKYCIFRDIITFYQEKCNN